MSLTDKLNDELKELLEWLYAVQENSNDVIQYFKIEGKEKQKFISSRPKFNENPPFPRKRDKLLQIET